MEIIKGIESVNKYVENIYYTKMLDLLDEMSNDDWSYFHETIDIDGYGADDVRRYFVNQIFNDGDITDIVDLPDEMTKVDVVLKMMNIINEIKQEQGMEGNYVWFDINKYNIFDQYSYWYMAYRYDGLPFKAMHVEDTLRRVVECMGQYEEDIDYHQDTYHAKNKFWDMGLRMMGKNALKGKMPDELIDIVMIK